MPFQPLPPPTNPQAEILLTTNNETQPSNGPSHNSSINPRIPMKLPPFPSIVLLLIGALVFGVVELLSKKAAARNLIGPFLVIRNGCMAVLFAIAVLATGSWSPPPKELVAGAFAHCLGKLAEFLAQPRHSRWHAACRVGFAIEMVHQGLQLGKVHTRTLRVPLQIVLGRMRAHRPTEDPEQTGRRRFDEHGPGERRNEKPEHPTGVAGEECSSGAEEHGVGHSHRQRRRRRGEPSSRGMGLLAGLETVLAERGHEVVLGASVAAASASLAAHD